jgi:hypothetical protein
MYWRNTNKTNWRESTGAWNTSSNSPQKKTHRNGAIRIKSHQVRNSMNNITIVKMTDDKVTSFVPGCTNSSTQFDSVPVQFIDLQAYQRRAIIKPARIHEYTNTGTAQLHNK